MTPPIHPPTAEEVAADASTQSAPVLEHAYDDIQEYDNPLPGWWSLIFALSFAFSVGYFFYYHLSDFGSTPQAQYKEARASYDEQKVLRERAEAANVSEKSIGDAALDPKMVERGKAIFATRCASCHTADGRGQIGPNLTDNYQLHGTGRLDIFKTVRDGVPGTAMLAWGTQMPATETFAVATFVTTLRGSNLPGKAAEGRPVEAFAP